jgi:flagellar protein FliS
MYANAMQNYLQSGYMAERVLAASPLELIRMLYEGAMSAVDLAIEMLHANEIMARGRAITKAVDILGELRASLREGPEFSATVAELYAYMQNRLLEAHSRKSEEPLQEVSRLLKCLYEGWLGVMRQAAEDCADTEDDAPGAVIAAANPYESYLSSGLSGRSWQV